MTHDQYPHTPENTFEKSVFMHQEVLQFRNGDAAFRFRTKGDRTPLGFDSGYKFADDFYGDHRAIIVTDGGESYGIAQGFVIIDEERNAPLSPLATIDVTIGEPCEIPGLGTTNSVSEVLVRFHTRFPMGDEFQVDADSPFVDLERRAVAIQERRSGQN